MCGEAALFFNLSLHSSVLLCFPYNSSTRDVSIGWYPDGHSVNTHCSASHVQSVLNGQFPCCMVVKYFSCYSQIEARCILVAWLYYCGLLNCIFAKLNLLLTPFHRAFELWMSSKKLFLLFHFGKTDYLGGQKRENCWFIGLLKASTTK